MSERWSPLARSTLLLLLLIGLAASPDPLAAETHVIAGNFMWREAGANHWDDIPRKPWLGTRNANGQFIGYDQDDPNNVYKALQWAQAHGIWVMAPIWRGTGPAVGNDAQEDYNNDDQTMRARTTGSEPPARNLAPSPTSLAAAHLADALLGSTVPRRGC